MSKQATAYTWAVTDQQIAHRVNASHGVLCGSVDAYGIVTDVLPTLARECPDCVDGLATRGATVWRSSDDVDYVVNVRTDSGHAPTVWLQFGGFSVAVAYGGDSLTVDICPTGNELETLATAHASLR